MNERAANGQCIPLYRRDNEWMHLASLLVVLPSPSTAKGLYFLTLKGKDGMMNVIVNPLVYGSYRHVIRSEQEMG